MDEIFIVDMCVINAVNYHKFKQNEYEKQYEFWIKRLQQLKGFRTIEETTDYLIEVVECLTRSNELSTSSN